MRVVDTGVKDVDELARTVFSGLSPLVVADVADEGERIVVRAPTPQDTAVCPTCGASSERVHGYHWRTVADVPVDGRRVVVRVRVRRLVCPTRGCRHTFREQVPGVLERYQRRTARLSRHVKAAVKELAGRAGARLLATLAMGLSRHTALRALLRIPLPTGRTPRVISLACVPQLRFDIVREYGA
ncbi:zinc-finger of transposase IS204/IS1001/IS1096/IS1165 [Micromonospora inyonensis]|uniref:Zinc-finger of transposase IS204/IS1001/IS1096/IS1165 n=1 Tax=Micromonospora inyonensis TaxID=47866 RepID=A0A1C6RDW7_9ACTN|nr:zinc-finger of transposase IS204/IS1001/IS1096/IS1165 [Micromonospora inyonensis]